MLRGASLRVTRPRVAVLGAVHERPHSDTSSIIGLVREELGEVSSQAVYDVLRALTTAGLVRCIHPAGSVARYESRVGDNHHHLVCRSCGAITDVDCVTGVAPCLNPVDTQGFELDEAEVVYWGVCPKCSTDRNSESTL
ncbi:Fur family transcriptional regulator [Paraconexibacter sp.]|uniref:Fur family transcriptional regulator n=1 Tax=Paraconexibacter sp. TaxID=2949640 RepID=UPI003564EC4D